jgi:hypothetical protein
MAETRRDLRSEADAKLLNAISELVDDDGWTLAQKSPFLLQLAEAWAWVHSPSQSHGGGIPPNK